MTTRTARPSAGTGPAARWWALGAIGLAMLAVGLDVTVLNVALPTVSTSLHASIGDRGGTPDAVGWDLLAIGLQPFLPASRNQVLRPHVAL